MSFAWGVAILLADQWSKRTIQLHNANGHPGWGGPFRLKCVRFKFALHRNKIYEGTRTRATLVILWVLALVCAVFLYRSGSWFQTATTLAGLGLALGGAASNLLDILQRRSVVNFIDLGWWPVFNLADVAILAGLADALRG